MFYTKIISTGSYLPKKILTNDDLSQMMDTSNEWITTRTGIKERHIADDNESCADMAEVAAKKALEKANIPAEEIDLIVVGTSTPSAIFRSVATELQTRLGCREVPAFDVNAACSGFIYALSVADAYIKAGIVKKALVLGADLLTNSVNWQDRNTAVLFGDGAGAVVVEASSEAGIHFIELASDGKYGDLLEAPNAAGAKKTDTRPSYITMQGREVFKFAVKTLSGFVVQLLEKAQMKPEEIDYLIPHQANLRIISATAQELNMSMDKVITTVDIHANTSAASVPLALDWAVQQGKVKKGNKLFLEAFGGGFTWGGCIITY